MAQMLPIPETDNLPQSQSQQVAPWDDASLTSGSAVRIALNDYEDDAVQILRFLEQVKQKYIRSPDVRNFAVSLLRGLDNNDQVGQANRIIDFVRGNLIYVRDPHDSELVITPTELIRQYVTKHYMAGDCDDHVLLLNSLLGSIGFDTKFVGVKFGQTDVYNHVISGVILDDRLYQVDPCAKLTRQPHYVDMLIL